MVFFERKPPPPPRATHFDLATERGNVAIALRRHPRARNYTLRVGSAGRLAGAHHAGARLARRGARLSRPPRRLAGQPDGQAAAGAADRRRRHGPASRRRPPHPPRAARRAAPSRSRRVGEGPVLLVAGRAEHLRRRVIDFLKREARRDLERAALRHAMMLGVRVKAIRLRDQVSRWGSCTTTGHLSFSWRLVMAPPFVLDYLAAHEVAHLHEMNHSPRFWHLVESVCPETKHGPRLAQQRRPPPPRHRGVGTRAETSASSPGGSRRSGAERQLSFFARQRGAARAGGSVTTRAPRRGIAGCQRRSRHPRWR